MKEVDFLNTIFLYATSKTYAPNMLEKDKRNIRRASKKFLVADDFANFGHNCENKFSLSHKSSLSRKSSKVGWHKDNICLADTIQVDKSTPRSYPLFADKIRGRTISAVTPVRWRDGRVCYLLIAGKILPSNTYCEKKRLDKEKGLWLRSWNTKTHLKILPRLFLNTFSQLWSNFIW